MSTAKRALLQKKGKVQPKKEVVELKLEQVELDGPAVDDDLSELNIKNILESAKSEKPYDELINNIDIKPSEYVTDEDFIDPDLVQKIETPMKKQIIMNEHKNNDGDEDVLVELSGIENNVRKNEAAEFEELKLDDLKEDKEDEIVNKAQDMKEQEQKVEEVEAAKPVRRRRNQPKAQTNVVDPQIALLKSIALSLIESSKKHSITAKGLDYHEIEFIWDRIAELVEEHM